MEENNKILADVEGGFRARLESFGLDFSLPLKIGAAVSGGADSIAMLTVLFHILPKNMELHVVTVNHNIRPAEETEGDAGFVQSYCEKLGVDCFRVDIPRGKVDETARAFGCGMEDAARRLRYGAFADFKKTFALDYVCLAHNMNDQIETVLMRFLSGGDSASLSGIPPVRDFFLRPMIGISRGDIEKYLSARGVDFRTDMTNFDTSMLRNKIRHKIIPMLDTEFPGWRGSVYSLSNKLREDSVVVEGVAASSLEKILFESGESGCSFDSESFSRLDMAIRRRVVYRALNLVGPGARVPYRFVDSICRAGPGKMDGWRDNAAGISVEKKCGRIFLCKYSGQATESGFSVIIDGPGHWSAGPWEVSVFRSGDSVSLGLSCGFGAENVISMPNLCFPFMFRSRQIDDSILTSDGRFRAVSKILDDWKCGGGKRDLVPVVQELSTVDQMLSAVLGSPLGFRDWIVKKVSAPAVLPGFEN